MPRIDPRPKAGNQPPELSKRALFGTLPFDLAFEPCRHDLDPIEIAVALALTASARRVIRHGTHVRAFDGLGHGALKEEADYHDQHQRDHDARRKGLRSTAPIRLHTFKEPTYKAGRVRANMKAAGRYGYKQGTKTIGKEPLPEIIRVLISRSNLLRVANMSADGKNLSHLDHILRRLRKPVADMPPLLASVEEQPSGLLLLSVRGAWLEPSFVQVPLPLPTRSRPATSLYLFLRCIQTRPMDRSDSSALALCERIGIDPKRRQQAFHRALNIVNDHLGRLDGEKLRREFKIKVPGSYKVVSVDDGDRIRFEEQARPRPHHDDEEPIQAAVRPKRLASQPIERIRARYDDDAIDVRQRINQDQQRNRYDANRAFALQQLKEG